MNKEKQPHVFIYSFLVFLIAGACLPQMFFGFAVQIPAYIFLCLLLISAGMFHVIMIESASSRLFCVAIVITYLLLEVLFLLAIGTAIGYLVSMKTISQTENFLMFIILKNRFLYTIPFLILYFFLFISMAVSFFKRVPFGLFRITNRRVSLIIGYLIIVYIFVGCAMFWQNWKTQL